MGLQASTSGAVDSGLIPSSVKPTTVKLVFTASLIDAQNQKESVENKPASLLVIMLGKALSAIPPSYRVGDRWPSSPKRARYGALIVFL